MKYNNNQLNSFLASPNPVIKGFLVFGPDEGAVREISLKLSHTIVDDLKDAFRVADLTPESFKENPSVLSDEVATMSLTGGRRLVRVLDADDSIAEGFANLLQNFKSNSFVIISAGNLSKSSKLRKVGESAENFAVVACYEDSKDVLKQMANDAFKQAGVTTDYATISFIADNLGADRGVSRSEIEKLITYAGAEKTLNIDDVSAVLGDGSALSIDNLVDAAVTGNFSEAEKAMQKILREDENASVTIVRALIYHFQRLALFSSKMKQGQGFDEIKKGLYPPLHFKREPLVKKALTYWNIGKIQRILSFLTDAERNCKTTGNVPTLIAGSAVIKVASLARKK